MDGTLACGGVLNGSIDVAGEVDLITFTGTAGDVIDLTLVDTGGRFASLSSENALATVFAPSGAQVIAFQANSLNALTLPETGTYVGE